MKHLLEVLKIIDGAVNEDPEKVSAYAEQLALKLDADGEPRQAKRVRRVAAKQTGPKYFLCKDGTPPS